jgi:hypothetical protein
MNLAALIHFPREGVAAEYTNILHFLQRQKMPCSDIMAIGNVLYTFYMAPKTAATEYRLPPV